MMNVARPLCIAAAVAAIAMGGCSTDEVGQGSANDTEVSVHAFVCETQAPLTDGQRHTMSFSVVGLDDPSFDEDFVWPDDESNADCPGCPVTVTPADSPLVALNENGVVRREDGKLIVQGDADGFYWPTLVVYENSGYTRGYVRIEDGGGYVDEAYSTVSCTVTNVTPAPTPAPTGAEEVYGFYVNDGFDWADGTPLVVALYPPEPSDAGSVVGYVDFAPFNESAEITDLQTGSFRIEASADGYVIRAETEDAAPMTEADWSYADGVLTIDGERLNRRHQLSGSEYVEQCYALQVLEYELEESFTPWEYPGVDVSVDESGSYEVSFGCSTFDSSEAEITVGQTAEGDFEATVTTDYATYVLRIAAKSPRRGQVLFGESPETLRVMANVGCYP